MQNINLFKHLKESTLFGVAILDSENRKIIYSNRRLAEILEYSQSELIGKKESELISDKAHDNVLKTYSQKVFTEEYKEIALTTKSLSTIHLKAVAHPIEIGKKQQIFVIFDDITKEKQFQKLFFALSQINQLIVRVDDENTLLSQICTILVDSVGYLGAAIGLIDKNSKLFIPKYAKAKTKFAEDVLKSAKISVDKSKKEGQGSVANAYHTGKISLIEDVLNDPKMAYWKENYIKFNVYSACSIPIFKNKKLEYILLINDNIKQSFNDEQIHLLNEMQMDLSFALDKIELLKNLKTLNIALESSHEWAVIADRNGNITYANDAVSKISGYSNKELIGKNPNIFKSGEHNIEFYKDLWYTITKGKIHECRFVNRAKNGNLFYLDTIIVPISEKGEIVSFVDLSRDITETIQYQRQLKLQINKFNTLFNLTNLSIKSQSEEEFLKQLTVTLTETKVVDTALFAKKSDSKIKIENYSTKLTNKKVAKSIEILFSRFSREKIIEKSIKNKKVYIINNTKQTDFKLHAKAYNINSVCIIPIIKDNNGIGAVILLSQHKNIFEKESYKLTTMMARHIEFILNKFEENRLSRMIQNAIDVGFDFIIIMDKDFKRTYMNEKAIQNSGYSKNELLGKAYSVVSSNLDSPELKDRFYQTLSQGKTFSGIIKYKPKDSNIIQLYANVIPFTENGKITHYIAIEKELDENSKLRNQLQKLMKYDSSTGLLNLKSFKEEIDSYVDKIENSGKISAVAIINPLSFKDINNALSFASGNKILNLISKRLKSTLRPYDIVAKLESDRFGLFIKDIKQEEDIVPIFEKILQDISKPYKLDSNIVSLSFNIGLSVFPNNAKISDGLLDLAQTALSQAKSEGENRIAFSHSNLKSDILEKLELKAALKEASKKREFIVYYQPYVDINKKIAGAEALIRWKKGNDIVLPIKFIQLLENTDIIVNVENQVMDIVLAQISSLKLKNKPVVPISVNLSEKMLNKADLTENILTKIKKYNNIDNSLLRIEIIERSFLKNFENVKNTINLLKEKGVTFALDDFGTGYSSLSYLSELSVAHLKVDISFIRKIINSKHTRNIVESIIFISKQLNIKTIAEGVETKEQFELLKKMGCDYFQGYLFYKPMPSKEFELLMTHNLAL
jgi:PAS domain S-box-containing protein/diguanylate cyclase (GGDEF)-like protein